MQPNDDRELPAWLKTLSESAARIRLAPGVVGKTAYGISGIIVIWLCVLWRLTGTNLWLDIPLVIGGCVASYVFHRWSSDMQRFAAANPALALMEGADITDYSRFQAQAKGQPAIDSTVVMTDPTRALPTTHSTLVLDSDAVPSNSTIRNVTFDRPVDEMPLSNSGPAREKDGGSNG